MPLKDLSFITTYSNSYDWPNYFSSKYMEEKFAAVRDSNQLDSNCPVPVNGVGAPIGADKLEKTCQDKQIAREIKALVSKYPHLRETMGDNDFPFHAGPTFDNRKGTLQIFMYEEPTLHRRKLVRAPLAAEFQVPSLASVERHKKSRHHGHDTFKRAGWNSALYNGANRRSTYYDFHTESALALLRNRSAIQAPRYHRLHREKPLL